MASTWKPTYLWLRTSRHWTKPLLILAARFDIGPGDTLTARLEAIGGLPEFERRPGARISR